MKKLILFVMLMVIVGCGSDEKNDGRFCYESEGNPRCYYVENLDDIECTNEDLNYILTDCNIESIGALEDCKNGCEKEFMNGEIVRVDYRCRNLDSYGYLLVCEKITQ